MGHQPRGIFPCGGVVFLRLCRDALGHLRKAVTDIYRDALRKLEAADPHVTIVCPKCKEPRAVPCYSSLSMCECGGMLKAPKEDK